jgi:hypothetical protein
MMVSNERKNILFGEAIMSSTMWRGESGMVYNAFYMPRLGYGTPSTTLTKQNCEEIQKPVVNAIVPKMGIARSSLELRSLECWASLTSQQCKETQYFNISWDI